ncbi:TPA: DUF1642 domain-containing protein [Streptococcus pyogenes]
MNKQELISMYERISNFSENVSTKKVIKNIQQLNDQPKPVLPKTVAIWLETCKDNNKQLRESLNFMPFGADFWLSNSENQDIFARAWLDGYTVDEEKRYTVKVKADLGQYLGKYYLNNEKLTPQFIKTRKDEGSVFTKKELEEAGFGWVFDCEGVEVQEVE